MTKNDHSLGLYSLYLVLLAWLRYKMANSRVENNRGLKRIHCVFQWKWVWWLYQSKISRETELIGYLLERFTLGILSHNCGNWLSLKSVGQASRVETETGLLCYSLEAKFLFSGKRRFLLVRPSAGWTKHTHIIKDNLLNSESIGCKCQSYL